jgi:hypothetical protein
MKEREKENMTNQRFKDFGSGNLQEKAPLSFKIHGEEFHCVPEVQGKLMLDMIANSSAEDPAKAAAVVSQFFNTVLQDESWTRFDALLNDKHRIVTVETLAEITGWLVEEYTGRPEQQPDLS